MLCAVLLLNASCGGTWTDNEDNFKRVFGFARPNEVQVLHSYYWKSAHWSTEYRYYIELKAPNKFVDGLTSSTLMTRATASATDSGVCGGERPKWFLAKSPERYEMWQPKSSAKYRVYRDKEDGELYVCDERL